MHILKLPALLFAVGNPCPQLQKQCTKRLFLGTWWMKQAGRIRLSYTTGQAVKIRYVSIICQENISEIVTGPISYIY